MKEIIKSFFDFFGVEIKKKNNGRIIISESEALAGTMGYGLRRMKEKKIIPDTIIDLGAAQGRWSLEAMKCWPDAKYMLVEPLSERKETLDQLRSAHANFFIVNAAAGSESGSVNFHVSPNLDGSGIYDEEEGAVLRKVSVITIDEEVKRLGLKPPYLIKFDTHGFEVPILEGAKATLAQTSLIVMECYGFHISKNALVFHEMSRHLEKLGFRLADVVDVLRRPGDKLFWQCDAFFLASTHSGFSQNTYA